MRILLTGSAGQVGWELARHLPVLGEVVGAPTELRFPAVLEASESAVRPDG